MSNSNPFYNDNMFGSGTGDWVDGSINAAGAASNVQGGTNPPYALSDFRSLYPQFATVPDAFVTLYLNLANASINQSRWCETWQLAMGLFIAHFCTIYLMSMANATDPVGKIIAAGEARGLVTSNSAGDVSESIDYSQIAGDLQGWAMWKATIFGQQLATFGRLVGKGGMWV